MYVSIDSGCGSRPWPYMTAGTLPGGAELAGGTLADGGAELCGKICGSHFRYPGEAATCVRNVGARSLAGPAAQGLQQRLQRSYSNRELTLWSACVNRIAFASNSATDSTHQLRKLP